MALLHRRALAAAASALSPRTGRLARLGIAALCAALLAGCKVNQQKEIALYRQVLDEQMPAPAHYDQSRELTLREAMVLANRNSEDLSLRGEEYVQALIQKHRIAAAFLPTVSFQPSFTIEETPGPNGSSGTGPGGTGISGNGGGSGSGSAGGGGFRGHGNVQTRFEAPLVGNMNVFRGFGDVANLRAAEAVIAQRREQLRDLQATVLLNVAQVYYQVLRSERSAEVLANTLRVQEARLADVQQQFANGLATRLSVAQQRAQVDSTRVALVQAQSDVRNGRSTLALLIGVPAIDGPLHDDITPPDARAPEAEFERQALEGRQDLRAAKAQIEAARQGVQSAIAEYYPSVSLNVAGFLYREFYSDASRWNSVLSANLPIFSAGIIQADVRLAWSRLRQAALNESAVRRQAVHDVQIAYENLQTSERRIHELEDEVAASDEAYQQARNAFQNSLATNLDVLTAQDQLLNAELQLAAARYDRMVFYLDLVRSTGRLVEVVAPVPATQPSTRGSATTMPTK